MHILFNTLLFILISTNLIAEERSASTTVYANSIVYVPHENSYVHVASYDEFRILTDVNFENFGEQLIVSYEGETLYDNEGRNDYVLYPYFFILVSYYHAFEVVTVSQWPFDGVNALTSPTRQYIEFYE